MRQIAQMLGQITPTGGWLGLMRRQFWMIALLALVGSLSVLAYSRMQAPSYEASAVVQVRPGADVLPEITGRITARDNLAALALRQGLFQGAETQDHAAAGLLQALSIQPMMTVAGQTRGFAPQTTGVVVSVRLSDADMATRVANDVALQMLDLGNSGALDAGHDALTFYRGEEVRLWQEVSALRSEAQAAGLADSVGEADQVLGTDRKIALMQDQYDLVRQRLADQEIAARLDARARVGQYVLVERATSAVAISVVQSWMLVGVAGSLLLAVTLAFVLERVFPVLATGPWWYLDPVRARLVRAYRLVDDPDSPIFGFPRFAVLTVAVVATLVALSRILG